jgi:hypothetical protein
MSISTVTRFFVIARPCFQRVSRRHFHGTPDRVYLDIWNRAGIDFAQHTEKNMRQSPEQVKRIMQTSATMQRQGRVPFLHARPAGDKVIMKFHEAARPTKPGAFIKYLRSPSGPFAQRTRERAWSQLPREETGAATPDILSLSYALASGIRPLESASSWGFVNHFKNQQYFPLVQQLRDCFESVGLTEHALEYFGAQGRALIRQYNRLETGDFFVVGIPESIVDRYLYDAKPYNVPTGKKASEVAADPAAHLDTLLSQGTHMAAMPVCAQIFDPDSGISVVNASDPREVVAFCGGDDLVIDPFSTLVSAQPTEFEATQLTQRKKIDVALAALIEEFVAYLQTGHCEPDLPPEDDSHPDDFPAQLI